MKTWNLLERYDSGAEKLAIFPRRRREAPRDMRHPLTDLQKHLVGKVLLYPDGKRVVKNLSHVAFEVVVFTEQPVTSQFLRENFLQRRGGKYSRDTCDNARDFANRQ